MKFKVWEPMEMDRDEAVVIEHQSWDPLLPALKLAKDHPEWFTQGEREVWVEDPDGGIHRFKVWVEPVFKARPVGQRPSPRKRSAGRTVVEGHEHFGDMIGDNDE